MIVNSALSVIVGGCTYPEDVVEFGVFHHDCGGGLCVEGEEGLAGSQRVVLRSGLTVDEGDC